MKLYSLLRIHQYELTSKVILNGSILDVGGVKDAVYQKLVKGNPTFHVINIDTDCKPDTFVDIEKKFPFENDYFDGALSLNVFEHVFDFENAFSETVRVVKPGSKIVCSTPFIYQIHGSPDDYLRYTPSAYTKLAEKYNCSIVSITPLGYGFFSVGYQLLAGVLPGNLLKSVFLRLTLVIDLSLNKISSRYRNLTSKIPLGFFVIIEKR